MKLCPKCGNEKSKSDFPRDARNEDGLRRYCKSCAYEMTIKWNRSKEGVITRLWHKHNQRSKQRGMPPPDYDREWLRDYIMNHPDFDDIYNGYVASGYDVMMSPSIDRLNDYIGYTKDNIRLVTFAENMDHAWEAGRNREHENTGWAKGACGDHRPVVQFTMSGVYLNEFISVSEACRQTGSKDSKVSHACSGKRKSHNGFQWMYKEDYLIGKRPKDLSSRKNNGAKKRVEKLADDMSVIATYESCVIAGQDNGVTGGAVQAAATKGTRCCGHKWRYVSE